MTAPGGWARATATSYCGLWGRAPSDCVNRIIARLAAGKMMPSQIAILGPLLVGLAASVGTMAVHGIVVHAIVMTLRRNLQRRVLGLRVWVNLTFVMTATLLALAGHLAEIAFGRSRSSCVARSPISALPFIHRLAVIRLRAPRSYCRRDGSCWGYSKLCPEC
jgi:hypothetical protein